MSKKYVLSVPNFSEGRDITVVNSIVEEVKKVPTVKVVTLEPEANFNRTVLTFICEIQYYKEAILKMAKVVFDNINMEVQQGKHPRIGALDTVPVFPLQNVTLDEATSLAEEMGMELFKTYNVPIYFSGKNARTEYKKSNTNIRKGQYEGLKEILKDRNHTDYDLRKPDLSVDGKLDDKKGACTVSSDYEGLVAYNVYIDSEDAKVANDIAKIVKSSEKGWTSIKSIGFKDEGHAGTAVSMNVFNCSETPLSTLYDFVNEQAVKVGHKVIGTGLVGPIKLKYLVDSARLYGYEFTGNYEELIKCLKDNMGLDDFEVTSIIEYYID